MILLFKLLICSNIKNDKSNSQNIINISNVNNDIFSYQAEKLIIENDKQNALNVDNDIEKEYELMPENVICSSAMEKKNEVLDYPLLEYSVDKFKLRFKTNTSKNKSIF